MIELEEEKTIDLHSTRYLDYSQTNAYTFWDIRAPDEFIVLVTFEDIVMESPWDGFTHLYFGDEAESFSSPSNSCSTWTRLTDGNGQFIIKYKTFASMSQSIKIIVSSMNTRMRIAVSLQTVTPRGEQVASKVICCLFMICEI